MPGNRVPAKSPYSKKQKILMLTWWTVELFIFRLLPHKLNPIRCFILKLFGAKIGYGTFIHRTAKIWHPWNLQIGNNSGIGFEALIYNLAKITIGNYATISQKTHLNTGSHDYSKNDFPLVVKPINIGDNVFIGTETYIGPGLHIGEGAVIGARSVVTKNMPSQHVCVGHPCKPIKKI